MRTDFGAIDFPPGSMSPTAKQTATRGWDLTWKFARLVTGQRIGMDLPEPDQSGAARGADHLVRAGVAAVLSWP